MTLESRPAVDGTPLQLACWECADLLLAKGGKAPPKVEDPAKVWSSFATHDFVASARHAAYDNAKAASAAERAIQTMLSIGEGKTLVREMPKLRRNRVRIRVHFLDRDAFPPDELGGTHEDANFFAPGNADAGVYDLYIAWVPDAGPRDQVGANDYKLGVSEMADSVFHELLHVWFIHTFGDDELGHGGGPNDRVFARRARDFRDEMLPLDRTRARSRPP